MLGQTLSHYQILERIGGGGMGEVYLAFDSRLSRRVALKVLPPELAESGERKKRFETEAKAVAALNHPHIVTVYSVEESEGIHFITMELVEGKTLSEVIPQKGLPLRSFIELSIPLADALSSAHAHGITHRDLKPGNIMVNGEGRLKVLDFGLAKLHSEAASSALSEHPTRSMTGEGRIVGTVSYMSPEQAEGKTVDHRTDVFSLGIVFYEMLTGQHPFLGETPASTLSAILKDTPRSVTELNREVPRELSRVVRRCLSKEPPQRYQSCLDLRNDLEDIKAELASSADAPSVSATPSSRGKRIGFLVVGLLAGTLLAVATLTLMERDFVGTPVTRGVTRFTFGPPEGGRFGANPSNPAMAVSPDGRSLAFVVLDATADNLWLRSVDSVSARPVPGTGGAWLPFWSPDGQHIAFVTVDEGKLKKVAVSGGPSQTLAEGDGGGTWNREGVILFGGRDGLYRVSSQGGEATPVTTLDVSRRELSHAFPVFLPDGRRFLYLVHAEEPQNRGIYAGSLDSEEEKKRILSDTSNVAYVPPGYLVFVRESALLAQSFDAARLELTDDPVTLAEGAMPLASNRYAPFSVSADALAYREGGWSLTTQLVWMDRKGREVGTVGAAGLNTTPSLSPDETRVAMARWDRTTGFDIWLIDLTRATTERLTSNPGFEWSPVWSPDGESVAFSSNRNGTFNVYSKLASGPAPEELVFATRSGDIVHDWSSDGRILLVESTEGLWVVPTAEKEKPYPLLSTKFWEGQARISRDSRWIAYTSNDSGRGEVYVQEFREGGRRWPISTRGGLDPRWRSDGRELFYLEPGPPTAASQVAEVTLMSVEVKSGARFEAAASRGLFRVRVPTTWLESLTTYAVDSQGERFLFSKVTDFEPPLVTLVLNWQEALSR